MATPKLLVNTLRSLVAAGLILSWLGLVVTLAVLAIIVGWYHWLTGQLSVEAAIDRIAHLPLMRPANYVWYNPWLLPLLLMVSIFIVWRLSRSYRL